jgi:acyl-CoA synthetase (AMP-forming)/AMP-acid ligase II
MHHGYGLSEYAGALCLVRTGVTRQDTSAGYVVDGAELRIVDSEGKDVAKNERGEIWMRGVGLTPGYFRDQQATDMVMRPGGWYASGDLGFLDHDAALTVVGRLKEMIIRSGFNVYPGEVELVLSAFPDIERVAVVGRLEVDGNDEIVAFIEAVSNKAIDLTALQAYAAGSLAPYKRPSRILQVDTFPMTISGKVLKRKLIELLSLE